MGYSVFVDRKHQPTMKEVLSSIGSKREMWENLDRFISENYRVKRDLAFYGRNYGWAVRLRQGGKALLSMYPGKGSFILQIVLGEALAKQASRLKLGKTVMNVLQTAHEFPEGRWLFIRIESKQDVSDVQQLLSLKAEPPGTRMSDALAKASASLAIRT
jgi:hypothetical protein